MSPNHANEKIFFLVKKTNVGRILIGPKLPVYGPRSRQAHRGRMGRNASSCYNKELESSAAFHPSNRAFRPVQTRPPSRTSRRPVLTCILSLKSTNARQFLHRHTTHQPLAFPGLYSAGWCWRLMLIFYERKILLTGW